MGLLVGCDTSSVEPGKICCSATCRRSKSENKDLQSAEAWLLLVSLVGFRQLKSTMYVSGPQVGQRNPGTGALGVASTAATPNQPRIQAINKIRRGPSLWAPQSSTDNYHISDSDSFLLFRRPSPFFQHGTLLAQHLASPPGHLRQTPKPRTGVNVHLLIQLSSPTFEKGSSSADTTQQARLFGFLLETTSPGRSDSGRPGANFAPNNALGVFRPQPFVICRGCLISQPTLLLVTVNALVFPFPFPVRYRMLTDALVRASTIPQSGHNHLVYSSTALSDA